MPLYRYKCDNCNFVFENIKTFKDGDLDTCPNCGFPAKRQIAACNFTFGWRLSDSSHIPGNKDKLVRDI